MKRHLSMGFSAFALTALLAGCAGSTGSGSTGSGSTGSGTATTPVATSPAPGGSAGSTPGSAAAAPDLTVSASAAGSIVVGSRGMSVYFYKKDVRDSGTSACTGGCLTAWPPVLAAAGTPTVDGVTGTVGTITTPDGKKQLTLNGLPVYYYAKDLAAGDTLGQGVGGIWYLATPSGDMVTAAAGY